MTQTQTPAIQATKPREWLTIRQVADELHLHTNTIYAMVKRGDLEALRYNKRVIRVPRDAMDNLLTTYQAGEFGMWGTK